MAREQVSEQRSAQSSRWIKAFTPPVIRKALIAAVVVGSILVLLNQGDHLFSGQITPQVLRKSFLTPIIPFCVTMLGAVLNSGTVTHAEELRPGRAALRRSLIIAIIVGGVIIAVNQGDIILAGAATPVVWIKILVTPCVPFCVSLYGAYLAYRNALARQQG
jgi:predicted cation transporter